MVRKMEINTKLVFLHIKKTISKKYRSRLYAYYCYSTDCIEYLSECVGCVFLGIGVLGLSGISLLRILRLPLTRIPSYELACVGQ